jgi:hypothetical protein
MSPSVTMIEVRKHMAVRKFSLHGSPGVGGGATAARAVWC